MAVMLQCFVINRLEKVSGKRHVPAAYALRKVDSALTEDDNV